MTQIKAVVFDHGGVLSRGGEKGTNEKAASRAMGLAEAIVIPDLNEALKRGSIGNEEYVREINRRFPDAPRALTMGMWDEVYASLAPDPLAYEFARRCRDSGLRTAILTSINPSMADRLRADGSYDGFDPLVMSCYVGCAKPDPEIYQIVEDGLPGVAPEEILFLDDQDKCCDGARRRGWQAIRVDSTEQMIRDATRTLRDLSAGGVMTPDQVIPGDLLVDESGPRPVFWFVMANLPGRDGIRLIRQDGTTSAGCDLPATLLPLTFAYRAPRATHAGPGR